MNAPGDPVPLLAGDQLVEVADPSVDVGAEMDVRVEDLEVFRQLVADQLLEALDERLRPREGRPPLPGVYGLGLGRSGRCGQLVAEDLRADMSARDPSGDSPRTGLAETWRERTGLGGLEPGDLAAQVLEIRLRVDLVRADRVLERLHRRELAAVPVEPRRAATRRAAPNSPASSCSSRSGMLLLDRPPDLHRERVPEGVGGEVAVRRPRPVDVLEHAARVVGDVDRPEAPSSARSTLRADPRARACRRRAPARARSGG